MRFKEVFCPECGEKTKVDLQKQCNFCQNCGYKIELSGKESLEEKELPENDHVDIDKKLEEVKFYYETSVAKREATNTEKNPVYYLKAQDLLTELSEQVPLDYRVWWELSKPLDYGTEKVTNDFKGQFSFHENYFDKALDLADIETKKQLIHAREEYEKVKLEIKTIEEKKVAQEKAEQEKIDQAKATEQRRQEAEKERKRQEEEKKQLYKEECTVKGVRYNTLEEAKTARHEQKLIDDLKEQLLSEKSRRRQKKILDSFNRDLQIPIEQGRYEMLKSRCADGEKSYWINFGYGISVLICLIIKIALEVSTSANCMFPILWGSFGIWIWPIWKVILVIKNRKRKRRIAEV